MILKQQDRPPITVKTVWTKTVRVSEVLYIVGVVLVLLHFAVEIGMIIGSVGKLYPVPQWVWRELDILVYLLVPIMLFRLFCVVCIHTLPFSQKESYVYVGFVSIFAFFCALKPGMWSYVAFPVLCITYLVQVMLDSRLPLRESGKRAIGFHIHPLAHTNRIKQTENPNNSFQSRIFAPLTAGYHHSSAHPGLPQSVVIWNSPVDTKFLRELRTHLRPKIRQGRINLWTSEDIRPGANRQEERTQAIQSAAVVVILVSANLLEDDFLICHELTQILLRAKTCGTLILLLHVNPCDISESGLESFPPLNSPEKPLGKLNPTHRREIFQQTASRIYQHLRL